MNKKQEITVIVLMVIFSLGILLSIFLSFYNHIDMNTQMALLIILSLLVLSLFNVWKKSKEQDIVSNIFELKSKYVITDKINRGIIKTISFALLAIALYLQSYFFSNKTYFMFVVIALFFTLTYMFLTPSKLIIKQDVIVKIPFKIIKRKNVKNYILDKDNRTLVLEKQNGKNIYIIEIKNEDIDRVEELIKN